MSAFIVSIHHIRALVNAGLNARYGQPLSWRIRPLTAEERAGSYEPGEPWGPDAIVISGQLRRELTPESAELVGSILLAENQRSVNYRYDENELEYVYTHRPSRPRTPVELLKAIDCYEYQACETPDWEDSEAAAFCEALRSHLIGDLPGYHDAPWSIDEQ
ncbi:hypothetical protein [Leucobacter ruminantium]|uniref:Uncharacterized protein n=1 Tax=Leucobacter ruminantium TaxID=1289170 RepID=A0A939RTL1_9MICO|nr:hypothetical protein [Leucobacter ruminantium]MBO1804485.1 hypothetical protein [Leucobacter ruminantium]